MTQHLRTALIWMLMLALPAQGMAALAMQMCEVSVQQGVASADLQARAEHHPGMQPSQSHHEGHASAKQPDSNIDSAAATGNLCSLCAFCVGAVALTAVAGCSAPMQAAEPSLAHPERFVGHVADAPERPPRFFLA